MHRILLPFAMALALAACGQKAGDNERTPGKEAAAETIAADAAATSDAAPADFDVAAIPLSDAALGAFPYFSLPTGYEPVGKPQTQDFGHFLFWTGKGLQDVEGTVYFSEITAADGKNYSAYELKKNIDAVVREAGGVLLTDSKIPVELRDQIPREIRVGMPEALGDIYNNPVNTWLIRRNDRQIWVHFTSTTAGANWTIVETKPFEQTATLLPAAKLRDALTKDGKATIQVHFATDRADILPASQPQIGEVAALLKQDSSLRLGVNGHTDDSGSADHNRTLSSARAKSVVAALVAAGIASARLEAKGFGADRPVADNATEAGKARNRRVELVRL